MQLTNYISDRMLIQAYCTADFLNSLMEFQQMHDFRCMTSDQGLDSILRQFPYRTVINNNNWCDTIQVMLKLLHSIDENVRRRAPTSAGVR
jgi:hypothetical protein